MSYKILEIDPYLMPYKKDIEVRMKNYAQKKSRLLKKGQSLSDFSNAHEYFGFHKTKTGWYYREWAPNATSVYLTGDFNGWQKYTHKLKKLANGVYQIFIKGLNTLYDGCHVKTLIECDKGLLERVPIYARRVEQDEKGLWCAVVTDPTPFSWKVLNFKPDKKLFIYECHVGMAQDKLGVGTYLEFTKNVLPRIKKLGYNAIQIMAIMEHPYYASFGYQVSSFFAPSSRFGTINELKNLIDVAHQMGIAVLLDVVHSHAIKNTYEGLNEFDGTDYQFFHTGQKGNHPAWDTKLFDYGKNQVIHFLLSNLKYWLLEFKFDGFRFDGVTSMIYHNHGLGTAFTDYDKYFSLNTDLEAVTYLQLANALIKEVNPNAITIAEDMSALPGMCLPIEDGGVGFDYRLHMGTPDMWIKLIKHVRDEDWSMWWIYGELTGRRPNEKYIGYTESHDQALVGDKTIMFRLCDSLMYDKMSKSTSDILIDRGIALHKLIRFITLSLGSDGYLNFMGNEFGHPEWIDFPREGNNWSYLYCRRQWHLCDNPELKYSYLYNFDKEMISFAKEYDIFSKAPKSITIDDDKKVLVYERNGVVFALNFHPTCSYEKYKIKLEKGKYKVILSTDTALTGGYDRVSFDTEYSISNKRKSYFEIYLPARVGVAIKKIK